LAGHFVPSGADRRYALPSLFHGDDPIEISFVTPLDLYSIFRHRKNIHWANTEQQLLHGLPNVFTTVSIETLVGGGNWFTQSIRSKSFTPLAFGQVEFNQHRARINWLLPCHNEESDALFNLVENLAFEAGLRGSIFLLASALLDSEEFQLLRHQGFCTYGWEKFWQVDASLLPAVPQKSAHWRSATSSDQHEILQFQRRHLAPALRAVTPLADEVLPDNILVVDGVIQGIATIVFSSSRAVMQILLDPRIINPQPYMQELIDMHADHYTAWYIRQLAGQDWMEEHLQSLAQPVLARRELLVKHFAIREKLPLGILNHSTENSHPDPIAPYIHSTKS
jgi:hypothetical protein